MEKNRESMLAKLHKDGKLVIFREDYSPEIREILEEWYANGRIELIVMNEATIVQSRALPDTRQ